jgi:hypothetical protein
MIRLFNKTQALVVAFPMVDSTAPASFKTGLTPTLTAYAATAGGTFSAHAIAASPAELGSTGVYTVALTAAEADVDHLIIKATGSGAADSLLVLQSWDSLLASDMGVAEPQAATIHEALMAARGHAMGTREMVGDVETVYTPDRSTQLYSRKGTPAGGPYTKLAAVGTFVLRVPLGQASITTPAPWTGDIIEVPLGTASTRVFLPITPVQIPLGQAATSVFEPNVSWV